MHSILVPVIISEKNRKGNDAIRIRNNRIFELGSYLRKIGAEASNKFVKEVSRAITSIEDNT